MSNSVKRVFYVRYVADPSYTDILAQRPDVRLDKLENDSDDGVAAPILAAAHAYQIGSARDEIATKYYATAPLLARMPNLLVVSTSGAGYDTVDLKDCTAAGVLVVNQAGGNREAVAQHVLGMLLCLAKRIVGPTARCAAERWSTAPITRAARRKGAPSASSGWAMSDAASPSSPAGCSACRSSPAIPTSRPTRWRRAAPPRFRSTSCCGALSSSRSIARSPKRRAA